MRPPPTAEHDRMEEDRQRVVRWRSWGAFLAERAWGTVREDYSATGDAWSYFSHEHARSRAYRWSEDGIAGFCDRDQRLCLALALWNERDPILKERFFGLTGTEGNHGEDVKEVYYFEDATPTASYLRMRYLYPQRAFPYEELRERGRRQGLEDREIELWEVGAFEGDRYFDVTVEYAKRGPSDVFLVVTAKNRGPEDAPLHLLPTLWFRNTWSWSGDAVSRPQIKDSTFEGVPALRADHPELGPMHLYVDGPAELLFTENETNTALLFGDPSGPRWTKDAFHRRVVGGDGGAVNPERVGSKACAWRAFVVPAGGEVTMRLRLSPDWLDAPFGELADTCKGVLAERRAEADAFYEHVQGPHLTADRRLIHRQASAGLLWSLQFYHYDVGLWLEGDRVAPPASRKTGRNADWRHVSIADVISMPDSWEYPWFAAWDLAFHALAMASVDIDTAKAQLKLLVKEWYQHPNGQMPAYEWEFSDLNPPVIAWAAYQLYKIERKQRGKGDRVFLERLLHKLLINFAWWVNKRDEQGNNVFEGGFLGLDNVSIIDRSEPLPQGILLEQADATAWMAMYCLDLMRISIELALENSAYEDLASKFLEHFLRISRALHHADDGRLPPWDEEDGFYFDILREGGRDRHVRVRSMVGLVPLFAVHVITPEIYARLPNFRRRTEWFLRKYPNLAEGLVERPDGRHVLTAVTPSRIERLLTHLFREDQFLSPHGPRSLSKEHERPVSLVLGGRRYQIAYEPGESLTRMKGGNSNWRGPVWMPMGYMVYRSLLRLAHGFGDVLFVPAVGKHPPRSLHAAADELAERLISLFELDAHGRRPIYGQHAFFQDEPSRRDSLLFHEYFHAETGEGLGAAHQTGWTALVADLVLRRTRHRSGQS